ncbi:hypothetical protein B0H14DRAFT_3678382 [Mycena olivaceomarginata]|nr:hypothetical protein B0H14DRAFT_3678382 [Mycena olivaceomarginata]
MNPESDSKPNTVLADTCQKHKDECLLREALQAKCTELEGQLKNSAHIAAKAMRERLEVEKKMRKKSEAMAEEMQDVQGTCTKIQTANNVLVAEANSSTERYGLLQAKYIKVKEDGTDLRASLAEQDARTLREMVEVVEGLQEEVKEVSASIAKYREFFTGLPLPERPPPAPPSNLDAVCSITTNLHGILPPGGKRITPVYQQNSMISRFLNHVLYLPKRIMSVAGLNYLAYGPTSCYERATDTWSEGSDLIGFHGGTRELFVKIKGSIVYVGTYKCHDLRPLQPKGTNLPTHISPAEIINAALGVPRPLNDVQIIKQRYPKGIKVEATGLQCVGFNMELYESLRQRFADQKKRKAEKEDLRGGKAKFCPWDDTELAKFLATHDPTGKCESPVRVDPRPDSPILDDPIQEEGPTFEEGIRKDRETLPIAAQNKVPGDISHRRTESPSPFKRTHPLSAQNTARQNGGPGLPPALKRTNKRLSRAARDTKTISVEKAWHVYAVTVSVKQTRKLVKETKKLIERTRKLLKARALAQTQPEVKAEDVSPKKVHAALGRLARESGVFSDRYVWRLYRRIGSLGRTEEILQEMAAVVNNVPIPIDIDSDDDSEESAALALLDESWFKKACKKVPAILGEKKAMIAHLIGAKQCKNASSAARSAARKVKNAGKKADVQDVSDSESDAQPKRRKRVAAVEKAMTQTELKVFKGIDIPFSQSQIEMLHAQFLRATISANLPFRWVENPEVIKLFLMFRSAAGDVIPGLCLKGEYVMISTDGWKATYSVTGVDASARGKAYLIDVIPATGKKKDGESMAIAFAEMIDKAEAKYLCIAVGLCCDNDGGSQNGRKRLLIVIGWITNHERVREIFDATQLEKGAGIPLSYLVANLTRWRTHSISFNRQIRLKDSLRHATIIHRQEIIDAQLGAEKNKKKIQKIKESAGRFCDLLDDGGYWKRLQTVADDIEPICYITNINQADNTRTDQVLLGFAGVFLHFQRHPNLQLRRAMMKRIEKRWAALDQPMFIFTMVLNPTNTLIVSEQRPGLMFSACRMFWWSCIARVKSRPPPVPLTEDEQDTATAAKAASETRVKIAFMRYMADTGVFEDFEDSRSAFGDTTAHDPILVWEQFRSEPEIAELADFAIMLLRISVNQGGNERDFSDFKIKKTCLRNRLGIVKTGEMSKVGADIRASHIATDGLYDKREKRKNHDDSRVADLTAVPRYADAMESEEEGSDDDDSPRTRRSLVNSARSWNKVHAKWMVAAWDLSDDEDGEELQRLATTMGPSTTKFLPRTLAKLFGGQIKCPFKAAPRPFTRETLLMELLAAEHSDEELDDGELEGSGDDYDG